MTNLICQCEQGDHFGVAGPPRVGWEFHPYGVRSFTEPVLTDFGTFAMCEPCRKAGHMDTLPKPAPAR